MSKSETLATSQPNPAKTVAADTGQGRVIVTYSRSLMSLVIARSLAARGVEVIGCDDVDLTALQFSKHCSNHFVHPPIEEDPEAALLALEQHVRDHAPKDGRPYVLIPGFRDARFFAEHRARFEPLIEIAAPDIASINKVHPKNVLARTAKDFAWSIPQTDVIPGDVAAHTLSGDLQFPRIIKPVDGVGGRGVSKLDAASDIDAYLSGKSAAESFLLQELIDGDDYCAAICADEGRLTGLVVYKNLRQFPKNNGAGAVRETVDAAPFLNSVRQIVEDTNWNGVAEIDYRWDGDQSSEPKLIEVNPRFWAGLFHCVDSGVDFPWLLYQQTLGRRVDAFDPSDVDVGHRTKTTATWALSLAEDLKGTSLLSEAQKSALSDAWSHLKDGAFSKAGAALKSVPNGSPDLSDMRSEYKALDALPSELSEGDDPSASLGILFAVSSLARHGKLPDELTHKESKASPADGENGRRQVARSKRAQRPIIGITHGGTGEFWPVLAIKAAVWLAGGRPVSLTAKAPGAPQSIDGLIFGGGTDVYPERYHGETKTEYRYDLARDELEASWADAARKEDLPVLGICRGMQMLNVLDGGTLHKDLSHVDDVYPTKFLSKIFYRKPVDIRPDTPLAEAIGCEGELQVNSIHSQAVRDLGAGLSIWAREPNGIIQAIGRRDRGFWLGVQFHPEFLLHRRFARNLFDALVEAARDRVFQR